MSDFVTPSASPTHPDTVPAMGAIDLVCTYWAGLPRDDLAPARAALDASALAPALPKVFIAELVTPRVARLRLVGHEVEDCMDMDLRGMPLTALFTAPARAIVTDALEQVGRGARVSLPLEGERSFGQPVLTGQLVLLPLCDANGQITRVLGVLESQGKIGRRPRRFAVTAPAARPLPPQAQTTQPTAPRKPALRVIEGGKR
jgi:hypothetical protein